MPRRALFISLILGTGILSFRVFSTAQAAWYVGPNTRVDSSPIVGSPANETSIAVNPNNPLHLIAGWNDYRTGYVPSAFDNRPQLSVAYSLDGGATWRESLFQGVGDSFPTPLLNGPGYKGGDPSVGFDSFGNPYACWISFGGSTSGVYVAKSFDGGGTFTQVATVKEAMVSFLEDKPYMAIDTVSAGANRDNIYVVWTNHGELGMAFSRSTDGGKTFSAPLPWPGTGGKGAVPAAGSDGALYVCYINDDSIFVGKSTNGGVSFLPEVLVADAARPFSWPDGISEFRFITFPSIAVDSSGGSEDGTVYVTWQDSSTGSDSDIVLSRSTDGGQTWSERVQINDNDESTHPSDQFFPWVAVDRKGRVAVFFNDRRNDRSNWLCDVYAAVSIDGAQTFLPNIRVSQHSFDPHLNGFSGTGDNTDVKRFRFFGDYLGITAAGESFYAAWSDTRDGGGLLWGDSNIYVARILDEVADGDGDGLADYRELEYSGDLSRTVFSDVGNAFALRQTRTDFNGDGKADIVFQNELGSLAAWLMEGPYLISAALLNPSSVFDANYRIAAGGDFNKDGNEDLLFQHEDGSLAVWYMEGTIQTGASLLKPANPGDENWRVISTADLNGDSNVDLVFQHADGRLAMWFMHGINLVSATLMNPSQPGNEWRVVGTGDFNVDGVVDIAFQHDNGTLAVWYMNGVDLTDATLLTPSNPGSSDWRVVSVADRNQDEQPDLLFQNLAGASEICWRKSWTTVATCVEMGVWKANDASRDAGWSPRRLTGWDSGSRHTKAGAERLWPRGCVSCGIGAMGRDGSKILLLEVFFSN